MHKTMLKGMLLGVVQILRLTAVQHRAFMAMMKRENCVVQMRLKDGSVARWYRFHNGSIRSRAGLHPQPDITVMFSDARTAVSMLTPPVNRAEMVHVVKQFRVLYMGPDHLALWFMQMMNMITTVGLTYGTTMPDGMVRYTTNGNGGPTFVFVKNNRIIRTTPIDLTDRDAPSWSITARGKTFRPLRRAVVNPHALCLKSTVYSEKRLLYPMKRVDFDPNGERNPQNRGISGYERISWDEAFAIVGNEIKRQKQVHGPGAIGIFFGSHHQWGNVGYYLSALLRFGNQIGFTRIHANPDSWEGWYWGAQHHYGSNLRVGTPSFCSTVEDCLKEAEMIVFWSSCPETTNGYASGLEGTQRRFWARELGIEFVHIDPCLTPTAQLFGGRWIPIRPGTDAALAIAIMYVWIAEDLYDKEYVATRTTGFEAWRDYVLGVEDGVPKTPEWQEPETGVPARVARALARSWGRKKTYLGAGGLGAGFGGAGRTASGSQWARNMILLMAMQGLGKPGVNFGNLQAGTPVDHHFYFPGYSEGGISGELAWTAAAVNNYLRMPHVISMNPVKQMIPRLALPDAITKGYAKGYLWDGTSQEVQFTPYEYPMPGYSRMHMLYRYGSSAMGTVANSERFVEAYRHESMEFVVNQSIYMEGDVPFADVILPACTTFEHWDISEFGNSGGYIHHNTDQLNHRMVVMQHKCIEPLGESKSDYDIFTGVLERLGLAVVFTEGCSELDWCKRVFDSSDVSQMVSWRSFVRKGYHVIPAPSAAERDPVAYRWYAEGRSKDLPEPMPLPAQYSQGFLRGLETQSGKIEFLPNSLRRGDPDNPERPVLNRYVPSWEGPQTAELKAKYPLQMISTHPRYSFHTFSDGKDSTINDIQDHRVLVNGYYYWVMRMNPDDARSRGIRHHEVVRVFNDRGSVLCAVDLAPFVPPGVVKTFESSAVFDMFDDPRFGRVDRGGCLNLLTPPRMQVRHTSGMGTNSCLVQIEQWSEPAMLKAAE